MNILAFETSCDETSAAIIQDGRRILTNVVASQIELHKRWGGVVPELASRQHILYIVPTLEAALKEANLTWRDIDAIAVTNGPGLAGALLVGVNVAKGLAFALAKPLLPVNHIEGHIYANWLIPNPAAKPKPVVTDLPASADAEQPSAREYRAAYEQSAPIYRPAATPLPQPAPQEEEVTSAQPSTLSANGEEAAAPPEPQFPLVALVVSGGHTELILMRGHGQYELLGKTIDDAAGEAFDKVGRILGLGYPGGPAIQKLVDQEHADPHKVDLPRAWLRGTYDFSFSGLKTAVMRKIDEYGGLPAVEKPRPFAEVEAEEQRSAAEQRAATSDSNSIRPGQAPTAMVSEPLTMPPPPDQPRVQSPRGFQPPSRLVRPAEPWAQAAEPPRAPYSMFDDEDEAATTIPADVPNPPRSAATGPGLERRPLRTTATPNLQTVPQPAMDDEGEDYIDEQPLPRTLSSLGRPIQQAADDQRARPQPPAQHPDQPPSAVLGSEQPPRQPASSLPQGSQPTAPQPASPAPATAQPPLNRPRPLPPSQPQRGFVRPAQLPPRNAPLAERDITPVPKGSNAGDDDRDERDYIDAQDDTPRSRVSAAADEEEPGDDNQPRRSNRSLGADAPPPQGVRGKVVSGDDSGSNGHAPVALIAAAFQLAVVEVLVEKTAAAAEQYSAQQVLLAGGVAANRLLREMMGKRLNVPLLYPPPALCTDNAAMIGAAAYYRYYHAQGAGRDRADTADWTMDIEPNAHFLGEV